MRICFQVEKEDLKYWSRKPDWERNERVWLASRSIEEWKTPKRVRANVGEVGA